MDPPSLKLRRGKKKDGLPFQGVCALFGHTEGVALGYYGSGLRPAMIVKQSSGHFTKDSVKPIVSDYRNRKRMVYSGIMHFTNAPQ